MINSFNHIIEILFNIGLVLNVIILMPQTYKIYRFKDAKSVSLISFVGINFIQLMTILHGIIQKDWALALGMIASLIVSVTLTVGILLYGNKAFKARARVL